MQRDAHDDTFASPSPIGCRATTLGGLPGLSGAAGRAARRRGRRAGRARPLLLVGAGLLGGGLLLFVVSQIDRSGAPSRRSGSPRITDAQDVLKPTPLSERERQGGTADLSIAQLEQGAWVQVADEDGRLAQQYSAQSVTPLPERELELASPKAIFYQRDGRVIQLSADRGRARVPKKALERGTLTGNVRIRVFRPEDGQTVDVERDQPVIQIDADDAHFDNSEIRCDGGIHLDSEMGHFDGRGLTMVLDPKSGALESLFIEKCTQPIRFVRGADRRMRPEGARERATPRPAPSDAPAVADRGAPPSPPRPPQPEREAKVAPNKGPDKGTGKATKAETRFFQLTLQDRVVVTRHKGGSATTLTGDYLKAVFAMEGDSAFSQIAAREAAPAWPAGNAIGVGHGAATPLGAIVAAALAATADDEETITITYDGPLELRPAGERLATADDIRVELEASNEGSRGAGVVTLDDQRSKAHVTCQHVLFRSDTDRVEANGTDARPLQLTSPRLKATGRHFWLEQEKGLGGFDGKGTVELASGGEFIAPMAIDPASAHVSRAADGTLHASVPAAAEPHATVAISWTDALDLTFRGAGGSTPNASGDRAGDLGAGDVQSATFRGAVVASGDSFQLDAARLDVGFGAAGGSSGAFVERIRADGDAAHPAVAARRDGKGSLAARRLDLTLRADAARGSAPAQLVAEGAVEARDPGQTLWTSTLTVAFRSGAAAGVTPSVSPGGEPAFGEEIATVDGAGGVQARIARSAIGAGPEGAKGADPSAPLPVRVFADDLHGDGVARSLNVTGKDVWVVRDTLVATGLTGIAFDEASRVATSPGSGLVRVFPTSIGGALENASRTDAGPGPAQRPTLPEQVALRAEWTSGFRFEETSTDARDGALELKGGVRIRSTPDRASTDAVDAGWLRLELDRSASQGVGAIKARGTPNATPNATAAPGSDGASAPTAAFESRRWANVARDGDPRLLRLEGQSIDFDLRTQEGLVNSRGKLLVHVPAATSDASASAANAPAAPADATIEGRPLGVGVVGSTLFTWDRQLVLHRAATTAGGPPVFTVRMEDGVRVIHADTSEMSLAAAWLEADFERLASDEPASANAERGVDLTGTGKLLRVRAGSGVSLGGTGRIVIVTEDFTIECDAFSYDAAAQRATLTAVPGSSVAVVPAKEPVRRTATSIDWDLAKGTLRIHDARGG